LHARHNQKKLREWAAGARIKTDRIGADNSFLIS
jgi:hypothetical protein